MMKIKIPKLQTKKIPKSWSPKKKLAAIRRPPFILQSTLKFTTRTTFFLKIFLFFFFFGLTKSFYLYIESIDLLLIQLSIAIVSITSSSGVIAGIQGIKCFIAFTPYAVSLYGILLLVNSIKIPYRIIIRVDCLY